MPKKAKAVKTNPVKKAEKKLPAPTKKTDKKAPMGNAQFIGKISMAAIASVMGKSLRDMVKAKSHKPIMLCDIGAIVKGCDYLETDKGASIAFNGDFTAYATDPETGECHIITGNKAFFPKLVEDQFMSVYGDELMKTTINQRGGKSVKETKAMPDTRPAQFAVRIGIVYDENSAVGYKYTVIVKDKEEHSLPPSSGLIALIGKQ